MESVIAYCGLICTSCPVHLATLEQDKFLQLKMRESISEQCYTLYGINITADDITDCDGCRANDDRLFKGCMECEIRKCAITKQLKNCAYCQNYACKKLRKHFAQAADAQARLDQIRPTNPI